MRVKVKGGKWKDVDKGPIALELGASDKAMIAAAPPAQSLFVFGDDPGAKWASEQNPEPKPKAKEKAPAKKKSGKK